MSQKTRHFCQCLQRTLVLFTLNDLLHTAPNLLGQSFVSLDGAGTASAASILSASFSGEWVGA